jgi:chromate transporter
MVPAAPPFSEFFRYWLKLGFINFGGPAGQIAMMHKDLVDTRRWVDERLFLRALNFCMLLPGPEAHQLAVYLGWRLHGYPGGSVAGLFFLLPSVALMLLLSWLAAAHGQTPVVAGVFRGIAGAVVAIVVQALWRIGKKALRHRALWFFAGASFALGQFLRVPFPLIVLLAGISGLALSRLRPDIFCHREAGSNACAPEDEREFKLPRARRLAGVVLVFAAVWLAVALPVFLGSGPGSVLPDILLFFSRASFVTFGGAYAVLSYVADYVVQNAWVTEREMVLGLGLAETTPGPLIMVTQFVGFLSAWNAPGGLSPLLAGVLGGLLTTFGMFLPSFLLVFAGAPYIEALTADPRLSAALTGITAAVVGVVLKLGVFFAASTFLPAAGIVDGFAVAVAAVSGVALWRWKVPVHILVLASGIAGAGWTLFT